MLAPSAHQLAELGSRSAPRDFGRVQGAKGSLELGLGADPGLGYGLLKLTSRSDVLRYTSKRSLVNLPASSRLFATLRKSAGPLASLTVQGKEQAHLFFADLPVWQACS